MCVLGAGIRIQSSYKISSKVFNFSTTTKCYKTHKEMGMCDYTQKGKKKSI